METSLFTGANGLVSFRLALHHTPHFIIEHSQIWTVVRP